MFPPRPFMTQQPRKHAFVFSRLPLLPRSQLLWLSQSRFKCPSPPAGCVSEQACVHSFIRLSGGSFRTSPG